jgi:tetratricopeptide (TPR) repeat protein
MTSHLTTPCPDHETLAAFIDGRADGAESRMVREHLASCPRCLDAVTVAQELSADVAGPAASAQRRIPPLAWVALAVAAALAVFLFLGPLRQNRESNDLQKLIAAAEEDPTRLMDGRLAAATAYQPYTGAMRGAESVSTNARLREIAGWVQNRGRTDAEGLHVLGVAHLLQGNHDIAVQAFDRALAAAPNPELRAAVANDLSAALLARAAWKGTAGDALRARQITEGLPLDDPAVAWNRAIAAEQLGDNAAASARWDEYLRVDPSSPWAEEARQRAARLR